MCSQPNCGGSCPSSDVELTIKVCTEAMLEAREGKYLCAHQMGLGSQGGSVCAMDRVLPGMWGRDQARGWSFVGGPYLAGTYPPLSFAASHYYKYKQQFIFPGKALLRGRLLSCTPRRGAGSLWGWVRGWVRAGRWSWVPQSHICSPKPIHCSRTACAMKILQGWAAPNYPQNCTWV